MERNDYSRSITVFRLGEAVRTAWRILRPSAPAATQESTITQSLTGETGSSRARTSAPEATQAQVDPEPEKPAWSPWRASDRP